MVSAHSRHVGSVISNIPTGSFHRRLLMIAGSAWAFDVMEVIIIAFTLPILIREWHLSGKIAAVFAPMVEAWLFQYSLFLALLVASIAFLIGGVIVLLFGKETKGVVLR